MQLFDREQAQDLSHGAFDLECCEAMSIADVARQRLRGVTLSAVANRAFERAVLDREQLLLALKCRPHIGQYSMQQRAAIDRLDAETDARHRLGTQPNLCLRPERAARLQLHRARPAARLAQRERWCAIVTKRMQC